MTDPYQGFDPYHPYETGPHRRPERPAPASWTSTVTTAMAPTLVAAVVAVGALISAPAEAMDRGPQPAPTAPGGGQPRTPAPTPTPSPTPTGPREPHAAKPDVPDVGKDNKLYAATMPDKAACPGFKPRTDELKSAELKPYLESLLDCLMAIHAEPLRAQGIEVRRPALKSEDEMGGSRCRGDDELSDWAGVYCVPDVTIYYRLDTKKYTALEHQLVMTHEFSHHLQNESKILVASSDQRDGDKAANAQFDRRVELQAACMSGAMLAGDWSPLKVKKSIWADYLESMERTPAAWQPSHGTGDAQQKWSQASVRSKVAYTGCNTWAATPAETT